VHFNGLLSVSASEDRSPIPFGRTLLENAVACPGIAFVWAGMLRLLGPVRPEALVSSTAGTHLLLVATGLLARVDAPGSVLTGAAILALAGASVLGWMGVCGATSLRGTKAAAALIVLSAVVEATAGRLAI
jgi:hypothetical protein